MVTAVQLGNFYSANGRNVLGGAGGSGIDTEALIEALTAAKRLPAVRLEDKIEVNDKTATALTSLKTLLTQFQDAANFLRNPPGVGNDADNVFSYTAATVTSNTAVAGSTYLSVSTVPGADTQSFTVDSITSIAKAKRQTTDIFNVADTNTSVTTAVPAAGQFGVGTFSVNGIDITLAEGDSLNTVAAKFNSVKDDTGVQASILQVASGQYKLTFSATATGLTANFDLGDPIDITPDSIIDAGGVFAQIVISTTQDAANAIFTLDGTLIERETNTINDAVTDVTFNLLQVTPALTELDVTITPDTENAKSAVFNFVNTYNELKIFAANQSLLNANGTYAEESILANNATLRSTVSSVGSLLSTVVDGLSVGAKNTLANVGVTFADLPESEDNPFVRNILNIDEAVLDSALAADFDGVRGVFEFSFSSDNTNVQVFSRTNALSISDFSLDIDPLTSTFNATYDIGGGPVTIALDAAAIIGGGYTLTGPAGSVLEGLVLIYGSEDPGTANITVTQGIADSIFNFLDTILDEETGALEVELTSIQDATTAFEDDIERIDALVAQYRDQLLARFAALEAAISKVNLLLQSLDAQTQAQQNA